MPNCKSRKVVLLSYPMYSEIKVTNRFHELARQEISPSEFALSLEIAKKQKVAVFIVAYNAENYLESVMQRIPVELQPLLAEVFVIDDSSTDKTFEVAQAIKKKYSQVNFNAYRTPFNRRYGGNQKLGYLYCIEKKYDLVILLHGDGQYAPEYLPRVISGFDTGADVVFASRMVEKKKALKGGMPFYKWLGNQVLTKFENKILGTELSEFHTGFRAYRLSGLQKLPFIYNSDDFHFDTEIIIQAVAAKLKINEVSIPTHYGDEVCHVNGFQYAWDCIKAVLKYKLVNLGLYYQRNFDFNLFETDLYQFKKSPHSLHQYLLREAQLLPEMTTVELGSNRGIMSSDLANRVSRHVAVDQILPDLAGKSEALALDLNQNFSKSLGRECFDVCVVLDVVEHMHEPEKFLTEVFSVLKVKGKLYMSTANIAYIIMRFSLLFGQFNYGKRGILDKTHHRLFTIRTLSKMLEQYGFKVEKVVGFAPPVSDLISKGGVMSWIESTHAFLSRKFPNLFAYNFLVVATRMDDVNDILDATLIRNKKEV